MNLEALPDSIFMIALCVGVAYWLLFKVLRSADSEQREE